MPAAPQLKPSALKGYSLGGPAVTPLPASRKQGTNGAAPADNSAKQAEAELVTDDAASLEEAVALSLKKDHIVQSKQATTSRPVAASEEASSLVCKDT